MMTKWEERMNKEWNKQGWIKDREGWIRDEVKSGWMKLKEEIIKNENKDE